jgi:hypothetical protein
MADSGVRYRYKGRFISALKATRLNNLRNVKKLITTAYTFEGKASHTRKGYKKPLNQVMGEALAKERGKAEKKRSEGLGRVKASRAERQKEAYGRERRRAAAIAEDAAKKASREDISIGEALDEMEFDSGGFDFFSAEDIERFADEFIEQGEEYFDFDMTDLENEDRYAA